MKKLKCLLFTVFLIASSNQLFAHALWIETTTTGKIGQSHEVKIYYGEYASNEREETAKWYSDVKTFSLWLTTPGQEKVRLNTKEGDNFYGATFTPEKDGVYTLTVVHEAKELGGTTKYEFSSIASVAVGKTTEINLSTITNSLKVSANEAKVFKNNTAVQIKAELNGKPLSNKHIAVFSPEGWAKEYTTDENGNIFFKPLWPGRYVLEVSNSEKTTGDHHGKTYSAIWQGATSSFEVSK
jgi:uncharacterized GH25 family protein